MVNMKVSRERVLELLQYDSSTGIFTWKRRMNRNKAGSVAGWASASGHIAIRIDGANYLAHRLAWLIVTGFWPADQIDHANGNPADNWLANLRPCSHAENHQNEKTRRDNKLGLTGVTLKQPGLYSAEIKLRGRKYRLGYFKTAEAARAAYLAKKAELHNFQPVPRDKP